MLHSRNEIINPYLTDLFFRTWSTINFEFDFPEMTTYLSIRSSRSPCNTPIKTDHYKFEL